MIVISKAKPGTKHKDLILSIIQDNDNANAAESKAYLERLVQKSVVLPFYQVTSKYFKSVTQKGRWELKEREDRSNMLS
jgi:hypothetical protein